MKTVIKQRICLLQILVFVLLVIGCKDKNEDNNPASNNGINFNPNLTYGTMTDGEGNVYKTIKIGNQTWMAENLRCTKYRNGDPILSINDPTFDPMGDGYCNYNNDPNNVIIYGRLYNWYVVQDSRNVAPNGWHVPTKAEWTILTDFLGGYIIAGGKMKETGFNHWKDPNTSATNTSGFTALPAGFSGLGDFNHLGESSSFWTSTETNPYDSYEGSLGYQNDYFYIDSSVKEYFFSIRCVKD